ncbi:MAG: hypothetical protein HC808_11395 [Candidatus Competibacteraceae bacterium]|nr:hypothetical protein [Candidatus Competibacteraceae bacterium]
MALTDDLSDGFFQKLQVMCNNLGCDPQHMLKVWFSESIGIYADAKNPAGAYGLNQITNLAGVGWTRTSDEYLKLSAEEQLPFIEKYYTPYKGRLTSIARIYQVNFLPATFSNVTKPDDVLASKDGPYAWAYNANPALDPSTPKKGYITLGDLEKVVEGAVNNGYKLRKGGGSYQDRWKEIVDRLQKASSSAATSFPVPPWLLGWWTVTWRGQSYYYFFRAQLSGEMDSEPPTRYVPAPAGGTRYGKFYGPRRLCCDHSLGCHGISGKTRSASHGHR